MPFFTVNLSVRGVDLDAGGLAKAIAAIKDNSAIDKIIYLKITPAVRHNLIT